MNRENESNNFFIFLLLGFLFIAIFVVLVVSPDNMIKETAKINEMEIVHGYTKDSQTVYLNGTKIEGVDVNNFLILAPDFAKDNKWVYYGDGGMRNVKINNADPKTFEFLGGGYAKDKSRFFCCQTECEVMREINGSLEVLDEGNYAKDSLNAYRGCEKLMGIDVDSFRPLGVNYYSDKKAVYFMGEVIPRAESESFELINNVYGRDKNGIYYGSARILDADPETFRPLGDYYSKDKTFVYFQGKVLGSGVDSGSFETLENSFARDKNFIYYFGKKMSGLDRDSFEVLDLEYGRDKKGVYYNGKIVEKADTLTFVVLGNFFAKDVNFVYRYGQLTDFDVATFMVLENGDYKDKNEVYLNRVIVD